MNVSALTSLIIIVSEGELTLLGEGGGDSCINTNAI